MKVADVVIVWKYTGDMLNLLEKRGNAIKENDKAEINRINADMTHYVNDYRDKISEPDEAWVTFE